MCSVLVTEWDKVHMAPTLAPLPAPVVMRSLESLLPQGDCVLTAEVAFSEIHTRRIGGGTCI